MSSYKKIFCNTFELPAEVVMEQPLVMLTGSNRMYLENHSGIALYKEDKILIRINMGKLIIEGKDLEIKNIAAEYIYITGDILSLFYDYSAENNPHD